MSCFLKFVTYASCTKLASYASQVFQGRPVRVRSSDGHTKQHSHWGWSRLSSNQNTIDVHAIAIDGVEYDFLLSRPEIKQLKLNVCWDDTILDCLPPSRSKDSRSPTVSFRTIKSTDDVTKVYPELVCVGDYPPSTTKLEGPFQLNGKTEVRKRPYNLTHEKKLWLGQKMQIMLDSDTIRPSVYSFPSPIHAVPKGDGAFRHCTDYRAVNQQKPLIPFTMSHIDLQVHFKN